MSSSVSLFFFRFLLLCRGARARQGEQRNRPPSFSFLSLLTFFNHVSKKKKKNQQRRPRPLRRRGLALPHAPSELLQSLHPAVSGGPRGQRRSQRRRRAVVPHLADVDGPPVGDPADPGSHVGRGIRLPGRFGGVEGHRREIRARGRRRRRSCPRRAPGGRRCRSARLGGAAAEAAEVVKKKTKRIFFSFVFFLRLQL